MLDGRKLAELITTQFHKAKFRCTCTEPTNIRWIMSPSISVSFILQPLDTCGNWALASQQNGGHADKRYRYTLTSIYTGPESRRALGYARRRRGRGGRVIFDRAYSEQRTDFWDKVFDASVPNKSVSQSEVEKRLQKAADNEFIPIREPTSDPLQPQFRDFVSEQKWFVLLILIYIIRNVHVF